MPKPQRFCIFCGGPNLSKEHIWPEWAAGLFPTIPNPHNTVFNIQQGPHYAPRAPVVRTQQGHSITRKIRAPCKKCNESWMSTIEASAKAVMTPMILGNKTTLDATAQQIIIKWITLKAMVLEHLDEINPTVFRQSDRTEFYRTLNPPLGFQAWIAAHNCGEMKHTTSRSTCVLTISPASHIVGDAKNAQTIIIGFGSLLLLVYFTITQHGLNLDTNSGRQLIPIWPMALPIINWPPEFLTDAQAISFPHLLDDMRKTIG